MIEIKNKSNSINQSSFKLNYSLKMKKPTSFNGIEDLFIY